MHIYIFIEPSFRPPHHILTLKVRKVAGETLLAHIYNPAIRKIYMKSNYDRSETIIHKRTKNYNLRADNPLQFF